MEVDTPWMVALGAGVVLATFTDLVWTTITVGERRGPVSDLIARLTTTVGLVGAPDHGRRRAVGLVTAVGIPATWVVLLWLGFTLMFLADDDAVLVSATQQPVGALGRVAYAAGGLAGAGAGLVAGTETWQLVNNLAAISGLALVTLSLTYVMQVVSAVVSERSVMSQIAALGRHPEELVGREVGPSGGGTLPLQLVLIAQGISVAAQRHLAFPILQYFHSASASSAAPVNLARYDLLLDELERQAGPEHDATVATGRAAVDDFLNTLRIDASSSWTDRRQRLDAFVRQEGWTCEDVTPS